MTLYWILKDLVGKDVARYVCENYTSNPYQINPVSDFLNDTGETCFLFIHGPSDNLDAALRMTNKRVTSYEDSKWAGTVVLRDADKMGTRLFFQRIAPSLQLHNFRFIFWGSKDDGIIHWIPQILKESLIFNH